MYHYRAIPCDLGHNKQFCNLCQVRHDCSWSRYYPDLVFELPDGWYYDDINEEVEPTGPFNTWREAELAFMGYIRRLDDNA